MTTIFSNKLQVIYILILVNNLSCGSIGKSHRAYVLFAVENFLGDKYLRKIRRRRFQTNWYDSFDGSK